MLTCAGNHPNITPKSMHDSSCIPCGQDENEVMTITTWVIPKKMHTLEKMVVM